MDKRHEKNVKKLEKSRELSEEREKKLKKDRV